MALKGRALHFVLKIGDREATVKFFKEICGMKVLRHEEFEEGCKATCNGPYDGKWSKTMIGYGPEINNFVLELTYNYGIKSYKPGNNLIAICLGSDHILTRAQKNNWSVKKDGDLLHSIESPDGYKFIIQNSNGPETMEDVIWPVSNLAKSLDFWNGILGMEVHKREKNSALLGYSADKCNIRLREVDEPVTHGEDYGRFAIAMPTAELPSIEAKAKKAGRTILTPLVALDTPGKATVHVVILADPDGHEVCCVGDEAFQELSQVDSKADELLEAAMKDDHSKEWFAKHK